MGRKAGIMRVNPKTLTRKQFPCLTEMLTFLGALGRNNFDDAACAAERAALNTCMDLQSKKGKPNQTINYHLQRISRMMQR